MISYFKKLFGIKPKSGIDADKAQRAMIRACVRDVLRCEPPVLNDKEKAALEFIRAYIAEHNASPSLPEIARGIGNNSAGSIRNVILNLQIAGMITKDGRRWRSIRIVEGK